MPKESSIKRGSEDMYPHKAWLCNSTISVSEKALLPVTTENIRTRNFYAGDYYYVCGVKE